MADNSFLCSDAKSLWFDDLEDVSILTDQEDHQTNDKPFRLGNVKAEPPIAFPCLTDEKFGWMIEEEKSHLPKDDYFMRLRTGELDMSMRKQALDWISKAHSHYGFGALTFYLSMNYFDRFLSMFELPRVRNWTVQLLAVACLSLGAKMAEIRVPMVVYLQVGDPKYFFEDKTIIKMELLVLNTLKWRMHSYTPYTYIDYFLRKINNGGGDDQELVLDSLMAESVKLILSSIKGIDFLEFKPSEIAAAVAIFVAEESIQAIDIEKAMSCFILLEKDRVLKCHKLLKDLVMTETTSANMANASVPFVPPSPNGVIEAACLSFKSNEITVGSCPNSSNNTPETKRTQLDSTSFGNPQK